MELSKRLTAIGAMVDSGSRLADIGTDHGYLPIWLVEQGVIPSAIAMDINEGPLLRAKAHIEEHGLEAQISLRKSDGLEGLEPGEADTAVIAGMGGMLTIRILEKGKRTAAGLRRLVLSPQSEISEVRRYLLENGYQIFAEDMAEEEGKYYVVIKAGYLPEIVDGKETLELDEEPWSYIEEKYGRYLLRTGKSVFLEYLKKEEDTLKKIRDTLMEAGTKKADERLLEIDREILAVQEALIQAGTEKTRQESRKK
ncbi:class I SAM-dependent methyltransferase [Lacrimispora sp. NSJ-141]|uniref:Class I SAM-dependent methyltransferase n=1 Tax=Lientehia hominis TaxID=2897778 RepID=A0AAP2RGS5_9FIRM|nr:class I SAM-dependent methyltransferase [Lientehia hominis]MCD2491330.1 class I SAM-dependent methyltransferase [Lientehia hominis]